jgi:Endoglucanase Y
MFKKALFCSVFALLISQSIFAAAKFPFPQDQTYGNNAIKPAGADHNAVQAAYTVWLNNYYEEGSGMARIKWDDPTLTVSEGIGYGMLVFVYMDNTVNNTQGKFDKLWAYYKAHLDNNGTGLMNWKVQGFTTNTPGTGGATDGDIDVAFALCLAYYQWGDASYKTDATTQLGKIWSSEVSGNMLKPGDSFTDPQNPSYYITAGLDMFNKIKFDNNAWGTVATNCYSLLSKAANSTTGLVPDWCDASGTANSRGLTYTFDAARVPWRMGLAYCWYGDASAKTIAGNMNTWIKSSTGGDPSKIMSGYNLNGTQIAGTAGSYNLPTYIGPFACAAMVDASNQTWLNACYTRLCTFIDNDNYYNQCLKVLSLLLLTGNCLDFSTAQAKTAFKITSSTSPTSAGSVTVVPSKPTYSVGDQVTITAVPTGTNKFVSWGGDLSGTTAAQTVTIAHDMNVVAYFNAGASDLLDDCEDGDSLNNLGGAWFTYNDVANGGLSTVTPLTSPTLHFSMANGGANGSSKAATISYTLNKGSNANNPFAGFGFWIKKYTPPDTVLNISAATGLTFYFKGDTCDVRIETANITDFGYFFKRIPKSTNWVQVSVLWSEMAQATWAKAATFDRTKATKVAWQTPNTGVTGNTGSIWVDDIHLPGMVLPTQAKDMPSLQWTGGKGFSVSLDNAKSMTLRYDLAASGVVDIGLFDLSGKLVRELFSGAKNAGLVTQSLGVPEIGSARGTYLVQLKTAGGSFSDKVVLVK